LTPLLAAVAEPARDRHHVRARLDGRSSNRHNR
jgi:hypothetical protein